MTENGAALRSYTYDGAGNIVTDVRPGAETFAYTYNNRNRLSSVTRNGSSHASYQYNAFEQLISRNTSAIGGPVGTVHYVYDIYGHLIAEADGATGASLREYIWLPSTEMHNDTPAEAMGLDAANDNVPDLPLMVINVSATPTLFHIHADHLGRPIRMTDAAKATVWQATWKPWGEPHTITGTQAQNLRFPGQYFQIETGLAYNWHRHYDPVTGRYTQPDPLGFVDGPSVYAYARSSPYMHTDREGRWVWVVVGAGIGIGIEYYTNPCATWGDLAMAGALGAIGGGAGNITKFGKFRAFLRDDTGAKKISLDALEMAKKKLLDLAKKQHKNSKRKSTHDKHTKPRSGRPITKNRLHEDWTSNKKVNLYCGQSFDAWSNCKN
jgi:RHS repeat-associated protein